MASVLQNEKRGYALSTGDNKKWKKTQKTEKKTAGMLYLKAN